MPDPVTGIIGGISAIGSIGGAAVQSSAARRATRAQQQAADAAVAEQRRQFDAMQQLLQPYVAAGPPALRGLLDLAGLSPVQTDWAAAARANPELMRAFNAQNGTSVTPASQFWGLDGFGNLFAGGGRSDFQINPEATPSMLGGGPGMAFGGGGEMPFAEQGRPLTLEEFAQQWYSQNGGDLSQFQQNPQARAVAQIEQQPMFQALARQGEEAIAQNASATGGLRGGNTQGALARFRPQLLNQFIEQQYGRLAGITQLGQNSAAGVGNAGLSTGANISNILQSAGMAQAAGAGAQGQIWGNALGGLGGIFAGMIPANAFRGGAPNAALLPSVNNTISTNPRLF